MLKVCFFVWKNRKSRDSSEWNVKNICWFDSNDVNDNEWVNISLLSLRWDCRIEKCTAITVRIKIEANLMQSFSVDLSLFHIVLVFILLPSQFKHKIVALLLQMTWAAPINNINSMKYLMSLHCDSRQSVSFRS